MHDIDYGCTGTTVAKDMVHLNKTGTGTRRSSMLKVAVEGCCHGELDLIYGSIQGCNIDLLLICGDFECVRERGDLNSMAVPEKYRKMNSFQKYFSGKRIAPVLTIVIGGNHEASNVLHSLYHGGWIAPNIYFLGFGGVVRYRGLRIAGLSGIFNQKHYYCGHYEIPPFSEDTMRSIYHIRELEVFQMMHIRKLNDAGDNYSPAVDIFLSHDWPSNIWKYGNKAALLKKKPFFRDDMVSGKLGNPPLMSLMETLRPSYWFAAHLHVKFEAFVPFHDNTCREIPLRDSRNKNSSSNTKQGTQFLALDKAVRGREFIQIIDMEVPTTVADDVATSSDDLSFDIEWLAVKRKTHHLLSTQRGRVTLPSNLIDISAQDIEDTRHMMMSEYGSELCIPTMTVEEFQATLHMAGNPQTDRLLHALRLDHRWTVSSLGSSISATEADRDYLKRKSEAILGSIGGGVVSVTDLERVSIGLPPPPTPLPYVAAAAADPNELDIDEL